LGLRNEKNLIENKVTMFTVNCLFDKYSEVLFPGYIIQRKYLSNISNEQLRPSMCSEAGVRRHFLARGAWENGSAGSHSHTAHIRTLIECTGIVEGSARPLGQQLVGHKNVRLHYVD